MVRNNNKEKENGKFEETPLRCAQCGSLLEPHARFCGLCGWVIPLNIHANSVSHNPGNPGNKEHNDDEDDKKKKKKKKNNKNNDDDDDDDNEDDEEERDRYTRVRIGPEGVKFRQSSDDDEQTVRLNISIPDSKRKEWKRMAASLGESVSGLVREAMGALQAGLSGAESLEEWGEKMDEWGKKLERSLEKSGIKDIGEKIEKKVGKKMEKIGKKFAKAEIYKDLESLDKERIKKRIQGLIKLQKSIPIDKFSQALNISQEEGENLIYELAAEGIEGSLKEGVFKFTNDPDEVISKLFQIIDKM